MNIYLFLAANGFDWRGLLLGEEDWPFLLETVLRTFIMFVVILTSLRLLGKRGVKQLSVFELVVIIGLGSAAGDPMFYKDVGLLPCLIVFTMIVGLYTFITYLVGRFSPIEKVVEGMPVCLVNDGVFSIKNFKKEALAQDEFFSELRLRGVSHLGQVEEAFEEVSGEISVFFFKDEEVKYGLPIMPGSLARSVKKIEEENYYSCVFCGYTGFLNPVTHYSCPKCGKDKWVESSNKTRVQ